MGFPFGTFFDEIVDVDQRTEDTHEKTVGLNITNVILELGIITRHRKSLRTTQVVKQPL